jgi:hypothetical protein
MVSQQASYALGKVEDLSSYIPTELLLKSLSDENSSVMAFACWALGERKELAGLEMLVTLIFDDKDSEVREAAGWALTHIMAHHDPSMSQSCLPTLRQQPYTSMEHVIDAVFDSVEERRGFIAAESCQNHILLLTFCFQREEEPLLKRVIQDANAYLPLHPIQQALEDSMIGAAVAQIIDNERRRPNVGSVVFTVDIVQPDEKIASDVPTKLFLCFLECNHVRENDPMLSQDIPVVFWQDTRRAFDKRARNFMKTLSSTLFQHSPARR